MCKDKYPAVCHHISKKQCKENDSIKQACRQSCNLCDKDIGIQCKFFTLKWPKFFWNRYFLVIYKGTPACEDKSWCKSLFNGACLALGKREERRKYGEYCPIECRKEECAFEWEGGLVEHKIETNNDCKGRFCWGSAVRKALMINRRNISYIGHMIWSIWYWPCDMVPT